MGEGDAIIGGLIDDARRQAPGAMDRLLESYRIDLRLLARTGIDASLQGKADPSDLVAETLLKSTRDDSQRLDPRRRGRGLHSEQLGRASGDGDFRTRGLPRGCSLLRAVGYGGR
jgi:hypothetical protein